MHPDANQVAPLKPERMRNGKQDNSIRRIEKAIENTRQFIFLISEAAIFSTCCFCRLTQQLIEKLSEEVDECPLEQMKYEADKMDNANERVQPKHELHDWGKNN